MAETGSATGRARESVASSPHVRASERNVLGAKQIAEFWSAVQDCLVQFHGLTQDQASVKVAGLLRRLSNLTPPPPAKNDVGADQRSFDEMIYHEEPWYIACNLAENELSLDEARRAAYDQILQQNHLA